jgi:hypothetical protein
MVANDWKLVSVAELDGSDAPYQNAQGASGSVPAADMLGDEDPSPDTTGSGNAVVSNLSIVSSSTTNHWTPSLGSSTAGPNGSIRKNGASSTPSAVLGVMAMTLLAGFTVLQL